MKNSLKIDFTTQQIIMDRAFAKNCANVRSEEYTLLQSVRRDNPGYAVITRQIKKNSNKETYKGLTYEYMEAYIASHDNANDILQEYRQLRQIAQCHSKRYPVIKQWFLTKYPEITAYGLENQQQTEAELKNDAQLKTIYDKLAA